MAALWPRIYAVLNLVPKAAYACVVMYVFLLEVLYTQVLECELVLNLVLRFILVFVTHVQLYLTSTAVYFS